MSPILFSLYIHDLMQEVGNCGVCLQNYILPGLMFADDIVLISSNAAKLQLALNRLHSYFQRWKLTVNELKSKVLVFSNSVRRDLIFKYSDKPLELVESFKYLGLVISRNGSLTKAVDSLRGSALKVLHLLKARTKHSRITSPFVLCLLFEAIIEPVILYGSEIWGLKQYSEVERFLLKFCKEVLYLPYNAPNIAVYGETGTFPLWLKTYSRAVEYYRRLADGRAPLLVEEAFSVIKHSTGRRNNWFAQLQNIITKFNLVSDEGLLTKRDCIMQFQEYFINDWKNQLSSDTRRVGGNKLRCHRQFKLVFAWEPYLSWVTDNKHRIALTRLRTSCHSLAIETGRYHKPPTPENNRLCLYCSTQATDNELHFLLDCPASDQLRRSMEEKVTSVDPGYQALSKQEKMIFILSSLNKVVVRAVACYTYRGFKLREVWPNSRKPP